MTTKKPTTALVAAVDRLHVRLLEERRALEGEDLGPFVRNAMPNGAEVFFRDSNHSYWEGVKPNRDSWSGTGRLAGFSTLSKPFDYRPDGLMGWVERETFAACAEINRRNLKAPPADSADFRRMVYAAGLDYDSQREARATEGKNIHEKIFAALAEGKTVPSLEGLTPEERGYGAAAMKFWREWNPSPILSEGVVLDLDNRAAGRLDLLALFEDQGGIGVIDAKTGTFRASSHHVQVRGYMTAAERSGYPVPDFGMVLYLGADGNYFPMPCEATLAEYEAAIAVYRADQRISAEIREASR